MFAPCFRVVFLFVLAGTPFFCVVVSFVRFGKKNLLKYFPLFCSSFLFLLFFPKKMGERKRKGDVEFPSPPSKITKMNEKEGEREEGAIEFSESFLKKVFFLSSYFHCLLFSYPPIFLSFHRPLSPSSLSPSLSLSSLPPSPLLLDESRTTERAL